MVLRRTAGPVPRARCLLLAAVQAHTSAASPRTTPCPPTPSLPCPLPFPVRATSTQRLIPPHTSSFPAAGLSAEVAFAGAANPRAQNTRSHQGKS